MKIKLIAIGNRIMTDDAVGIYIAESLKSDLEKLHIEVTLGETDFDFCLSLINDGDFLIIIDSTFFGINPGTLTVMDLNKTENILDKEYSLHQLSLIKYLNRYITKNVKGFIIGIEAFNINFGTGLSPVLKGTLYKIKNEVKDLIHSKIEKLKA